MTTNVATMARLGLLALLSLFAFTLLPTLAWADSSPKFASDHQSDLFKEIQVHPSGYIDVDQKDFNALIANPRSFAVTVLLTAMSPKVNCVPCKAFQPEFDILAAQWRRNKKVNSKNVFVRVEYGSAGAPVFAQFGLSYAPALWTFPAASEGKPNPPHISYDFNQNDLTAQTVSEHLNTILKTEFKYKKPFNPRILIAVISGLVFFGGATFFVAPYIPLLLKNSKPIWMTLCIGSMIVFNSGQMWNSIRHAPYMQMGQRGPEYFAHGFQQQYGVETQIVSAIYSLLAFSFIALMAMVPRQRDPTRQRAGVYVWSAILLGTLSVLFWVFRKKNPSYPFRLFF